MDKPKAPKPAQSSGHRLKMRQRVSLCFQVAQEVIEQSDRQHPADKILHETLAQRHGLTQGERREISRLVFTYYRWRGWLDLKAPLEQQIRRSVNLATQFRQAPESFHAADLSKAVPGWVEAWVTQDEGWLRALQSEPRLWLRARKGTGQRLARLLGHCIPAGVGALADTLEYRGEADLYRTPEFQNGAFEIQDIASQLVGLICSPRPGESWWDACAGEGGKTLHLSDLMDNQGLIWASDRVPWRLKRLKLRARRAQVFNYRAIIWNGGARPPTRNLFDGVLVDAPCSGVGTWHRLPHARWTTTPADVEELARIQKHLLAVAGSAVKPGGKLVYAVCTLTRAETEEVVANFEASHPDFEPWPAANPLHPELPPQHGLWLWPQDTGGNGMFVAQWRRKPEPSYPPGH